MENTRRRIDVKLITDEKKLCKHSSKLTFVSSKTFHGNLVPIHKIKEAITPAYLGISILDLSKTLMYDFHHNKIMSKYRDMAKLLFTDTDSFTYQIQTEDGYKNSSADKNEFDNREYPENSQFFDKKNKKVIGKFKDIACGVPITEFVGVRSKMYSYMKENQKGGKTTKGIKKNVIRKDIKHTDYKNT